MAEAESFDYVVVGAGAAGAVLAARLAQAGRRVLVLEAGDDVDAAPAAEPPDRDVRTDHAVPAFHAFASENPAIAWRFFVSPYEDAARTAAHRHYRPEHGGVLYPRASTLGGCAAHHAMITVRPHDADWNHIRETMDDPSWRASNMHRLFRRLERCRHRSFLYRWLAALGFNPTGHGWRGWLTTEKAVPLRALFDRRMVRTLKASIETAFERLAWPEQRWRWLVKGQGDPNDERLLDERAFGVRYIPLSTRRHRRCGPRELLLDAMAHHAGNLTVRTNTLVTRVELDPATRRAVAVRYREGRHLYGASGRAGDPPGDEKRVRAAREIILCGGAFNTPQLLMLSGIGCPASLAEANVETLVDLPGVGRNLQDRYEISVVNRMKQPWKTMRNARFEAGDRPYRLWRWLRMGLYKSNGGMLAVVLRSRTDRVRPDLFCFAFLADFRGYFPGYAARSTRAPNYLSWVVLKAHTENRAGYVKLRSADPTEPPEICFRYFDEGSDARGEDLAALVRGVGFVRTMVDSMHELVEEEETPGRRLYSDEQLREHVEKSAWGHHACGTCAMAPEGEGGVVDSSFRVYGVEGLRVVDASIFPRIPGFFIATSVYVIAEKAAEQMIEEGGGRPGL